MGSKERDAFMTRHEGHDERHYRRHASTALHGRLCIIALHNCTTRCIRRGWIGGLYPWRCATGEVFRRNSVFLLLPVFTAAILSLQCARAIASWSAFQLDWWRVELRVIWGFQSMQMDR